MQIRRRVAQIVRQSVGQRGFVLARNRQLACPIVATAVDRGRNPAETEPTAEAIADTPQGTSREGLPLGRIERGCYLEQRLEVLGAAVHGKSPDIFQSEVWGDFADTPGARFVRCVREPHADPPSVRLRMDVRRAACICQYGAV